MSLDILPVAFILFHQFASGRLLISYNRLFWFLALAFTASYSLYLNFSSTMLPSYCLFIVMYFLFALNKPATAESYKGTLQAFQFLVLILSILAIGQFFAQFAIDGRELIQFFGLVPDFLLASFSGGGVNTIIPVSEGSSLIKSNGMFLVEPSTLSQMAALGILIEILEFRRQRYLFCLAFGYLLSYSGTGLLMLIVFLPFTGLINGRALVYAILVVLFAFGLSALGVIDLSVFLSRMGEFEDTRASGFGRFIGPFWLTSDYLHIATVRALLLGNGPGTTAAFTADIWYSGGLTITWIKLFYEYGLIGGFIFILYLAACCRRTFCPSIVVAALFFSYIIAGNFLNTPFLTLMIVLITLSGPVPGPRRADRPGRPMPSFAPRSGPRATL